MTIDQFYALQSDAGKTLLAQLAQEPLAQDDVLAVLARYRKTFPAALVNAAVELTQLRHKATRKFSHAATMFFTRDGLEMASSALVAQHTARRFAGLPRVMDLCCGIGGETLALAEVVTQVIAVDRETLHLEMARANARAIHLERRIEFIQADVTDFIPHAPVLIGRPEAIFIDPSRREARKAARRPEDYAPPLSWCLQLTTVAPRVAIKVSPALDYTTALAGHAAEVELVSAQGECKEAVLWLGEFRTCAMRATVLPQGQSLTDVGPSSAALGEVGAWLFEPDPAVIRAHLVQRLAGEYHLWRIDPEIAYLSGDAAVDSPFLTAYRVRQVVPWNLKRLNALLREQEIGHVIIKKRGFPLTPEELRPKLKLSGSNRATLICTRAQGKPVIILAEG